MIKTTVPPDSEKKRKNNDKKYADISLRETKLEMRNAAFCSSWLPASHQQLSDIKE